MRSLIAANRVPASSQACSGLRPRILTLLAAMVFAVATAFPEDLKDDQFLRDMRQRMMQMHAAMAVPPSGNIDADFVAMMVPHHQGAIDMARLQLRYGHSEPLRRIAQEIIVEQQQEIDAMRYAMRESK
jgi:uncharacterized protein (DUF305 family)